jgi:hypothetical protein
MRATQHSVPLVRACYLFYEYLGLLECDKWHFVRRIKVDRSTVWAGPGMELRNLDIHSNYRCACSRVELRYWGLWTDVPFVQLTAFGVAHVLLGACLLRRREGKYTVLGDR